MKIKLSNKTVVELEFGRYDADDTIAVGLTEAHTGQPYATLTVCIPERSYELGRNEIFVQTWGGNDLFLGDLINSRLFADTGRRVRAGYTEAAIWKLLKNSKVTL